MASSKAELRTNDDEASPCFSPFSIGNISGINGPYHRFHLNTFYIRSAAKVDKIISDSQPYQLIKKLPTIQGPSLSPSLGSDIVMGER
jgi:hypothetical protein